MTLLLTPPKAAPKAARKMKAEKPVDEKPILLHFDRATLTGGLLLKGQAYYFRAIMDDEAFLGWRLYRQDGNRIKQIDITDSEGVCECDCESSIYSGVSGFRCKHITCLVGFGLLADRAEATR
jgi:hypothetical protein